MYKAHSTKIKQWMGVTLGIFLTFSNCSTETNILATTFLEACLCEKTFFVIVSDNFLQKPISTGCSYAQKFILILY